MPPASGAIARRGRFMLGVRFLTVEGEDAAAQIIELPGRRAGRDDEEAAVRWAV